MQRYNKFILAILAAAGVIASSNLLGGQAELWVNTCIAAVSAALVYWVPNLEASKPAPAAVDVADLPPVTHAPAADVAPPRPSLADDEPGPAEDDDTGIPVA